MLQNDKWFSLLKILTSSQKCSGFYIWAFVFSHLTDVVEQKNWLTEGDRPKMLKVLNNDIQLHCFKETYKKKTTPVFIYFMVTERKPKAECMNLKMTTLHDNFR